MKTQYLIVFTLIGLFTVSTIPIMANDGTNCESTIAGMWGTWQAGCYGQQIYQQNKILIQENNQLIKLQEWNFCKPYSDETFYDISLNQMVSGDIRVCMDEIQEKTK